jgi:Tfp pilus assembly protein PilN
MPSLYNIVQKVRDFVDNSVNKIDKIYLTGTGCIINNVDLYFEEYFSTIPCEILKPYFISENVKINLKDYIEVNSAIALGMQGLGYGIKNLNFKKANFMDKLPEALKVTSGKKGNDDNSKKKNIKLPSNFSLSLKGKVDTLERWMIRTISGVFVFIIVYTVITSFLRIQTDMKLAEVQAVINETNTQKSLVDKDIQALNNQTSNYNRMIDNFKNYNKEKEESLKSKNAIPLLLTRIMNVIPKGVTLTSIENTTDKHVVINCQSKDYDLLSFFMGALKLDKILDSITSSSGVKQNGIISVTIEGDLP